MKALKNSRSSLIHWGWSNERFRAEEMVDWHRSIVLFGSKSLVPLSQRPRWNPFFCQTGSHHGVYLGHGLVRGFKEPPLSTLDFWATIRMFIKSNQLTRRYRSSHKVFHSIIIVILYIIYETYKENKDIHPQRHQSKNFRRKHSHWTNPSRTNSHQGETKETGTSRQETSPRNIPTIHPFNNSQQNAPRVTHNKRRRGFLPKVKFSQRARYRNDFGWDLWTPFGRKHALPINGKLPTCV